DIDHFKRINDTLGHQAGDEVLKRVAERLGTALRGEDVLARYGGEEFVVIARGIPLDGGAQLGDRLRTALTAAPIPFEGQEIAITASVGVASVACCGEALSSEKLLGLADGRLYRAKETGRNRVVSG